MNWLHFAQYRKAPRLAPQRSRSAPFFLLWILRGRSAWTADVPQMLKQYEQSMISMTHLIWPCRLNPCKRLDTCWSESAINREKTREAQWTALFHTLVGMSQPNGSSPRPHHQPFPLIPSYTLMIVLSIYVWACRRLTDAPTAPAHLHAHMLANPYIFWDLHASVVNIRWFASGVCIPWRGTCPGGNVVMLSCHHLF